MVWALGMYISTVSFIDQNSCIHIMYNERLTHNENNRCSSTFMYEQMSGLLLSVVLH